MAMPKNDASLVPTLRCFTERNCRFFQFWARPKQTFVAWPTNEWSKDQATKVCLGFNLGANSGEFA
jgi:hypothetical protein